jgi:predicted DNA-binding transcriptional regulator AlpA
MAIESLVLTTAPFAVDVDTAAAMLGGIGRSTFLERVSRGELPKPRKIGARSVWLVEELQAAARALPVSDERPLPKTP